VSFMTVKSGIPDAECYRPFFAPWLLQGEFNDFYARAKPFTLVSADRCHVLYSLAVQALALEGEFWECGVFRGGTAMLLADLLSSVSEVDKSLRLFDTFEGMPGVDLALDLHQQGDFSQVNFMDVKSYVGCEDFVHFHKGFIPESFGGLEDCKIAFAHVDVDIYRSILDCCEFIMPRLVKGGFVVFDDYGFSSCPGARKAVDEFFHDRSEQPLVLPTGQAVVFNSFGC